MIRTLILLEIDTVQQDQMDHVPRNAKTINQIIRRCPLGHVYLDQIPLTLPG